MTSPDRDKDDDVRLAIPEWCVQIADLPKDVRGCKGSDAFDGKALAAEAWGEDAEFADSGLTAFGYLWRRFGPPIWGSDSHKELVSYILGTSNESIFLTVGPSAMPLTYAVGYLSTKQFEESLRKPDQDWWERVDEWSRKNSHGSALQMTANRELFALAVAAVGPRPDRPEPSRWRDSDGSMRELNLACFEVLRELLRPVYIRDVAINILGRVEDSDPIHETMREAKRSKYAGLGVSLAGLETLLDDDDD